MSKWMKAKKSMRKAYKERGQLTERSHLGLLEKHKDYVLRARDYHRKQARLKIMHEKARNRNPDEFYYKMVNTQLKNGRHIVSQPEENYTQEELALMKTQDVKYLDMKLSMEAKKIERLKSSLHLPKDGPGPSNSHTIFVDSLDEVSKFDTAKHFNTTPKMASRAYNRLTTEQLSKGDGIESKISTVNHESASQYKELKSRIQRHKQLKVVTQKMKTKKDLTGKGHRIKMPADGVNPPTYRWKKERQK
ncbi:probable U3 small nucleolar RNA-associated protein 11 [Halichondria panicea]|uniref:probable U3 small nucleolar RNA-associated protein 11 n=1 Tax=Halichondria panicea TaxID=6063 RepID=UPI00312B3617